MKEISGISSSNRADASRGERIFPAMRESRYPGPVITVHLEYWRRTRWQDFYLDSRQSGAEPTYNRAVALGCARKRPDRPRLALAPYVRLRRPGISDQRRLHGSRQLGGG